MSGSNLIPRDPREPEIIDAEFEEVGNSDWKGWLGSLSRRFRAELIATLKNLLVAAGGLLLLGIAVLTAYIFFGPAVEEAEDEDRPYDISVQADAAAEGEADGARDNWDPSMLCSDEQVLDNVEAARRELLARLMTEMAQEGSYILPSKGNPIDEGAANARLTWPNGTQFVSMRDTGGDMSDNAIEVHCAGALEIRNAFKLPDNTWSPVFLTFPDTTFTITAGAEGFSLDFPDAQSEVDEAIFHVAGEQLPLWRLREISTAR